MKHCLSTIILIYFVLSCSPVSSQQDGIILIDSFSSSHQNSLGATRGVYQKAPSNISLEVIEEGNETLLKLRYEKQPDGWCGFYSLLELEQPFDASDAEGVYLIVKAGNGQEDFEVGLADLHWKALDDSAKSGSIVRFLSHPLSRDWQVVQIPMSKFPDVQTHQLHSMVINFPVDQKGTLFVREMGFYASHTVIHPDLAGEQNPVVEKPSSTGSLQPPRSLWVWNTSGIQRDRQQAESLVEFCKQQQIETVYLQLPLAAAVHGASPSIPERILENPVQLAALVQLLHHNSIEAHALDGYHYYALPEWHPVCLAVIQEFLRYQREAVPEARFTGLHLDIEPYLLPQFESEDRKDQEKLFLDYLHLNDLILQEVKSQDPTLPVGLSIPFWYEQTGDDGQVVAEVPWEDGKMKPVSYILFDWVDYIAIMDYRNVAGGPNGIIAHARQEMDYANATHRDGSGRNRIVIIGVETQKIEPEFITFHGYTPEYFEQTLAEVAEHYANDPAFGGFAIHDYTAYREFLGMK